MNEENKCLRCGGTDFAAGSIQSSGKVIFRVSKARFITSRTNTITVDAMLCMNCGHMDFIGDVKKARQLTAAC